MPVSNSYSSIGQNFIPLFHKIPRWVWTAAKKSGLFNLVGFFLSFFWIQFHKPVARNMDDVFRIFYLEFLKIPRANVEMVEMSPRRFITRCDNPCPILDFARLINVDTRDVCKVISETISNWFLYFLNPRLKFVRNYQKIRPYCAKCEEMVLLQ